MTDKPEWRDIHWPVLKEAVEKLAFDHDMPLAEIAEAFLTVAIAVSDKDDVYALMRALVVRHDAQPRDR